MWSPDGELYAIGPVHRWFFLKLRPGKEIDISKATDVEVSDFKWVSFEEARKIPGPHKAHVYEKLHEYFIERIVSE